MRTVSATSVCLIILLLSSVPLHAQANPKVLAVDNIRNSIPLDLRDSAIPPEPVPLDWQNDSTVTGMPLDRGLEVTHIRFDHAFGHTADAVNIRWCCEEDLFHDSYQRDGEYLPEDLRNDPVLYVAGTTPIIQVVLRSKQPDSQNPGEFIDDVHIRRATVWATVESIDPALNCGFITLQERTVYFVDGESRDSSAGESKYVAFDLKGPVPQGFNVYKFRFTFHLRGVWGAADTLIDAVDAHGSPLEAKFDSTAAIHVYSRVGQLTAPWSFGGYHDTWVNALVFTGDKCDAFGQTTAEGVADKVIEHLFAGSGKFYDHFSGRGRHGARSQATDAYRIHFDLTGYILNEPPLVNCDDQSTAVMCLANVAAESAAQAYSLNLFGYVNKLKFVGGVVANNPFFWKHIYWHSPTSGEDWTCVWSYIGYYYCYARSCFGNHSFVRIGAAKVIGDACVGPVKASDGKSLIEYLNDTRDTSTIDEQSIPSPQGPLPIADGTSPGQEPIRCIVHFVARG